MDSDAASVVSCGNEKWRKAWHEGIEYAFENDLFSDFETTDHLAYQHDVATVEYQCLPSSHKFLLPIEMPPLDMPSPPEAEPWVVPRRVAGVLESACRLLSDGERKMAEDRLCAKPKPKNARLEVPLLASNQYEDDANLVLAVSQFCVDKSRIRQHFSVLGGDADSRDDCNIFNIPVDGQQYAAALEETVKATTVAVTEKVIQTILRFTDPVKLTDDDRALFLEEKSATKPTLASRYLTPLLPPDSYSTDYFVPDSEECMISDPSQPDSNMGEALQEVESLVLCQEALQWPESEPLKNSDVSRRIHSEAPTMLEQPSSLQMRPACYQDEEFLTFPRPTPSLERPGDELPHMADSQRSRSGFSECHYAELSGDNLFEIHNNDEVTLKAKLAVPSVQSIASIIADWDGSSHDAGHWPKNVDSEALVDETRLFASDLASRTWYELDSSFSDLGGTTVKLEETIGNYDILEEQTQQHLKGSFDTHSFLMKAWEDIHRQDKLSEEEYLESPLDNSFQLPARKRPVNNADAWSALMGRWKRQKRTAVEGKATGSGPSASKKTATKRQELPLDIRATHKLPGKRLIKVGQYRDSSQDPVESISPSPAREEPIPAVQPQIIPPVALPKVILSTALPLIIRQAIFQSLPGMEFVERDFQNDQAVIDNDEADIVLTPSTGIVVTTMVRLRQLDRTQKTPTFHTFLARIARKYESLFVFVFRDNCEMDAANTELPELSHSDAMAFTRLQSFAQSLPGSIKAFYVGGGQQSVAKLIATIICQEGAASASSPCRGYLVETESTFERFLRKAGLNTYDAQIVLGVLRESKTADAVTNPVSQFIAMSAAERLKAFGASVGCRRALQTVSSLIDDDC